MSKELKSSANTVLMGGLAGGVVAASAITIRTFSKSNNLLVALASVITGTLAIALVMPVIKHKSDIDLAINNDGLSNHTSQTNISRAWHEGLFAACLGLVTYNLYDYASKIDNPWLNKLLFGASGISVALYAYNTAFVSPITPVTNTSPHAHI